MLKKKINNYYSELENKIKELDRDKIIKICQYLKNKIKNKNKIFVCGNGGSAAISDHFVTDFNEYLKRKSKRKYKARAISLSNSMSLITAISNDISYEKVFTEQIENFYDNGDCVIIFSCSGTSKNIVEASNFCKTNKLNLVTLTGPNPDKDLVDISMINFSVDSKIYNVIECIHMIILTSAIDQIYQVNLD